MKKYIKKYHELVKVKDADTDIITLLFNSLEYEDLPEFVEDLLLGDNAINVLFEDSRMFTADEFAFDFIVDLPYSTLRKIEPILQDIYVKAILGNYAAENRNVILKIQGIASTNKVGLDIDFIKDIVWDEDYAIPANQQAELLVILSKIDTKDSQLEWITDKVHEHNAYILYPAILSAYTEDESPFEGLQELANIPTNHSITQYFKDSFDTQMERAIFSSLRNGINKDAILKCKKSIRNKILKEIFTEITDTRKFKAYKFIGPLPVASQLVHLSEEALESVQKEISRIQSTRQHAVPDSSMPVKQTTSKKETSKATEILKEIKQLLPFVDTGKSRKEQVETVLSCC